MFRGCSYKNSNHNLLKQDVDSTCDVQGLHKVSTRPVKIAKFDVLYIDYGKYCNKSYYWRLLKIEHYKSREKMCQKSKNKWTDDKYWAPKYGVFHFLLSLVLHLCQFQPLYWRIYKWTDTHQRWKYGLSDLWIACKHIWSDNEIMGLLQISNFSVTVASD